jgi:diguanylate cyclase (GGDEF)-like protein
LFGNGTAGMSGASVILAINLFVAGLLAAAFLTVAAFDRQRVAARWFGAAYLTGMSNTLIEFGIATIGTSLAAVLAAFASILAAMLLINVGVARNYGVRVPWLAMGTVFFVSVAACWFIQDMPRDSFTRQFIYQTPYFVMQAFAVAIIGRAPSRNRLDAALMALLALSALQFLSKPFLFRAFGGAGATAHDYLTTDYAMVSQSMGTIFAIAIALMMLAILVRDVLADATARSETDALSELLNRAGFETRARNVLRQAAGSGEAVSLMVADLDHFKSINDTLGHAAGDRVIAVFANFLKSALSERHVAGRIGGEEFAILLPGTNVVAARLFAEGARAACSSLVVEGVSEHRRLTASFGVAELAPGESISELFARADKALYTAKNSGRDCVKIAPRPDLRRLSGGAAVRP